jgi:two-component system KDP operon response regulator KdpE
METNHDGTTSAPPLIVIVEDEAPIRRFLLTQQRPALVLLDLGLPDGDGLGIIREVRGWSSLPIIVISARGEEKNKISALDAGADDYLTKPFAVGELLARIRVALRHAGRIETGSAGQTTLHAGPITIDLVAHRVLRDEQEIRLTKLEFDLLAALARNAGKVVTHRYLLKEVWGSHVVGDAHYVRVYMANLRKKLELNPSRPEFLLTEQGIGYRLRAE